MNEFTPRTVREVQIMSHYQAEVDRLQGELTVRNEKIKTAKNKVTELCYQIEKSGASEELTKCSILASDLNAWLSNPSQKEPISQDVTTISQVATVLLQAKETELSKLKTELSLKEQEASWLANARNYYSSECDHLIQLLSKEREKTEELKQTYQKVISEKEKIKGLEIELSIYRTQYVHRQELETVKSKQEELERNKEFLKTQITALRNSLQECSGAIKLLYRDKNSEIIITCNEILDRLNKILNSTSNII